jgi:lysophospholipase L1-like esterase
VRLAILGTESFRMTRAALVFLAASVVSACGGRKSPAGPTSDTAAPQISCPADISIRCVPTATQSVTFDPPAVTGGVAPIQKSCNPVSGSAFPLGTTAVNCSASDASSRTATCSFYVSLTGFSIALRKYEAFGDSLTAGETGRPSVAGFNEIDLPNAYPTKLQQQFDATYPAQGVVVINRGHSLDTVGQTETLLRSFAAADRPDVVLLLTGYNNLTQPCGANGSGTQACRDAVRNLGMDVRSCIRHATEVDDALKFVFISTLTPPGTSGSNGIDRNAIILANDQIRQASSSEHAVLVDSYTAFLGHEADYVNVDGLHLKPAGYQALADAFFAAIQSAVQQTPLFRQP